ncbi:MAG: hypothetical protein ACRDPY_35995 [Streptosporangiaceae bacterium]
MAELKQLALDPLVAPAVVLGGEALDKRSDPGTDPAVGLSVADMSISW